MTETRDIQAGTELGSLLRQVSAAASGAMAHTLAHHINNPLQSITNSIFLAMHSNDDASRDMHLEQASRDLRQLSRLVGDLLLLQSPASLGTYVEQPAPIVPPHPAEPLQ